MKFSIEGWTRIKFNDLAGKKIVHAEILDYKILVLTLENQEYLLISVYDDRDYGVIIHDREPTIEEAISIGMVKREAYDIWEAEQRKEQSYVQEVRERNMLSFLKAKYEAPK